MQSIEQFYPFFQKPFKAIITAHQKPDGDAMGSSLALYHFLIQLGHDVTVVSPTNWAPFLDWMPGIDKVVDYEGNTILHSLVKYKDFERFKQLYERPDLSLSVENNKGETPIDLITDFRFSNLFIKKLLNDADDNKIKIYRNNQNIKSIDVEFTDLKKFHNNFC